jgi:GxxExxY protein
MNEKKQLLKCTQHILKLAEECYLDLGSDFKEDTYQKALAISFRQEKIKYLKESNLEIFFKGESLGLFRLDFLLPAQRNRKWQLKNPLIIETKAISQLNTDARAQLKKYLLSAPRNSSENFNKIRDGILLNWKKGDPDGSGDENVEGVEIELWTMKSKKFSKISLSD